MNADPIDSLLEKLCAGDAAAAERVFLKYEPFLRLLVRRQISPQLRAKFDSIDVVQSVFADILDGFRHGDWRFQDAAHLRAFLVKMTRNRFIDRVRQHRTAIRREQPLASIDSDIVPASRQPRPSEFVAADDLWDRLLAICPPRHHELLRLKRDGRSVSEIVERTGLNDGSVRRILRELARRLAFPQRRVAGEREP